MPTNSKRLTVLFSASFGAGLFILAFCYNKGLMSAESLLPIAGYICLVTVIVTFTLQYVFKVKEIKELKKKIKVHDTIAHLVNQSNDAIILVDLSGTILSWNAGAELMYGYAASDALGKNIVILIPPDLLDEHETIMKQIMAGTVVKQFETERLCRNKGRIIVELTLSLIKNDEGITICISGISRDISVRKHAEYTLEETTKYLKVILDNASDGFILIDETGVVKAVNFRTMSTILPDFKKHIVVGKNVFTLLDTELQTFCAITLNEVFALEAVQYNRPVTAGATPRWLHVVFCPFKEKGIVKGICITVRDITEEKEAEEQKEFDRNNLSALINNTNDLMWSVGRNYQLITCNHAFAELTKKLYGTSKLIGSSMFEGEVLTEQEQRFKQRYQRAFNGETFTEIEYTKGINEFWAETSFYPIYEGNSVAGTACFSRNITAHKKADELLQQSFKDKSVLASRMSTIINALPANIALLDKDGHVIEVNNTWRNFADDNQLQGGNYGIGSNYILIAESATNDDAADGKKVANGIRAILENRAEEFVLEYPCHSANHQKWYRMIASPLKDKEMQGVVIMHIDITEVKRLYQEKLDNKLNEQRRISLATYRAEEKERNQLGMDLHDNICQLLAALKMQLGFCIDKGKWDPLLLEDCVTNLDYAINETRDISHRMITPKFQEDNLSDAIGYLGASYANDKRTVNLTSSGLTSVPILPEIKEAIYRIAQENLNNIHKYAKASVVSIQLDVQPELIKLTLEDNGVGFDQLKKTAGVGLSNIHSRVETFNGFINIKSAPGRGCKMEVGIPLTATG